jgi:hypothetical protein
VSNQVEIILPEPHPGQQKVLDSTARWKVLMCGRRWGKSLVCQIIAINQMLAGKSVSYVTPTHELGKDFFRSILAYLPIEVIESDNQTDRKITLVTGGSVKFYSGENLTSFRGSKYHTVIVDEAAFIPDLKRAWGEDILATLLDYQGNGILISTPNGKDFFHALYTRGLNNEPGYESFHYSSYDNPTLPPGAIDELKRELTDEQHSQEILAIAGENSGSAFGSTSLIQSHVAPLSTQSTIVYGIDVASIQDWTVIIGLDENGCMTYQDRFRSDYPQTMDKIKALPAGILKVIDSTGVGQVVLQTLSTSVPNIRGFDFTSVSKPEIITQLIKDVQQGNIKYTQLVADEMSVFQYIRTPSGNYKYQARQGYHDDAVCALAIANKYRVQAIRAKSWRLY